MNQVKIDKHCDWTVKYDRCVRPSAFGIVDYARSAKDFAAYFLIFNIKTLKKKKNTKVDDNKVWRGTIVAQSTEAYSGACGTRAGARRFANRPNAEHKRVERRRNVPRHHRHSPRLATWQISCPTCSVWDFCLQNIFVQQIFFLKFK